MKLTTHSQLNPVFETVMLLYTSCHVEEQRKHTIAELTQLGFDGEAFYNLHMGVYDKYVQAFIKHRLPVSPDDFFFGEPSRELVNVLLELVIRHADWLTDWPKVTAEEARKEIIRALQSEQGETDADEPQLEEKPARQPDTMADWVAMLGKSSFTESVRWKLLVLLQDPLVYLGVAIDLINRHFPAFHKAQQELAKPLAKLIRKYKTFLDQKKGRLFLEVMEQFAQEAEIFPSLALPLGQFYFERNCYYGLLVDLFPLPGNDRNGSPDLLVMRLKALSDNSKLQIMALLKTSPKYNLEIAEQMGLTAATTSHHMNTLLACGLVTIQKKQGKVYYSLVPEMLGRFIRDLEQFLL